jgi:hypothetical protein
LCNSSTAAKKGVAVKYLSVPVPAGANISSIKKFLGTASKKPSSFVSPDFNEKIPINSFKA